jgi:hypothetical protein
MRRWHRRRPETADVALMATIFQSRRLPLVWDGLRGHHPANLVIVGRDRLLMISAVFGLPIGWAILFHAAAPSWWRSLLRLLRFQDNFPAQA